MFDLIEQLRSSIQGNIHDERKEAADELERLTKSRNHWREVAEVAEERNEELDARDKRIAELETFHNHTNRAAFEAGYRYAQMAPRQSMLSSWTSYTGLKVADDPAREVAPYGSLDGLLGADDEFTLP